MIERILIRQFAIIDQLEIDFHTPFTVLTGETGVGKSILIEAVAILLGGRSATGMIRHGAERAYIEGVFQFRPDHPIYASLSEGGWAEEGESSFVLSRELNASGKNTCRINGCTVSLNLYRQLADSLLDIHGQHDYQQLMQTQRQLDIFDAFGGRDLGDRRQRVKEAWQAWRELEDKLVFARENRQAFLVKKDFLLYQMQEIDAAKLYSGEEKELEAEIRRLAHSQRIVKGLDRTYSCLFQYADGASAYDLLSQALQQLRDLGKYDQALDGIYERLEPATYLIDEAVREIERYRDETDVSPARLEEAENRLYLIRALGKKYGEGADEILKFRESAALEFAAMEEFGQKEETWESEAAKAGEAYAACCAELTRLRLEVKKQLEERIDAEFLDLAMKAARFRVEIRTSEPGPKGADAVEFLISTNTGEPFLPLAKIASGGELSRITLAMKRILAASDTCETLLFDEIDSGIGGTTIQAVAEKLQSISREQQVVCVTHSPVIAAKAGQHFLLEKTETEGRTLTGIRELDEAGRVEALMLMLGGNADSDDLRRHAKAMLDGRDSPDDKRLI